MAYKMPKNYLAGLGLGGVEQSSPATGPYNVGMPGTRPGGQFGPAQQQWDIANRRQQGEDRRQRLQQGRRENYNQRRERNKDNPWLRTYGKSGPKSNLAGALGSSGVTAYKRGRRGVKGGGGEVEGSKINWSAIAAYQGMTPQQQRQLAQTSPHLVPQVNGKYIGAGGDILNKQKGKGGRTQLMQHRGLQHKGSGGGATSPIGRSQPGLFGQAGRGGGGFGGQVNQLRGQLFGQGGGQNVLHQQNMASSAGVGQMRQRAAASGRTENLGGQVAQFQGAQEQGRQNAMQQNQFQQISMSLQAMGIQADLAARLAEAAAMSGIQNPSQIMGNF